MTLKRRRYAWGSVGLFIGIVLIVIAFFEANRKDATYIPWGIASLPGLAWHFPRPLGLFIACCSPPVQWMLVALCLHGSIMERKAKWAGGLIAIGAVNLLCVLIIVLTTLVSALEEPDEPVRELLRFEAVEPLIQSPYGSGGMLGILMIISGVLLWRLRCRGSSQSGQSGVEDSPGENPSG